MTWRFRPPLWAWLAALPMAALLAGLGVWQLQRGAQKQELLDDLSAAAAAPATELRADTGPPAAGMLQRMQARGVYDGPRQLLLDNQSHEHRPGYHVWTPLRLSSGGLVLVNRGWVPQNPDRRVLPGLSVPEGKIAVSGFWRSLPEPGLRLPHDPCSTPAPWPRVVQYPAARELDCLYAEPVTPGVLLLEPEADGGYVRDWQAALSGVPPARHYAYSAQWFALCATLVFIFIKLNLKRT